MQFSFLKSYFITLCNLECDFDWPNSAGLVKSYLNLGLELKGLVDPQED